MAFAFVIFVTAYATWSLETLLLPILSVIFTTIAIFIYSQNKNNDLAKNNNQKNAAKHLKIAVKELPFQIIPFALIFFAVAKELAALDMGGTIAQWIISDNSIFMSTLKSLFSSGLAVNLFNDLPAASFFSYIIDPNIAGKDHIARAILVGLNIGCYITPVGALAGIMWFHKIKQEQQKIKKDFKFNIEVPTRSGLVKYGIIHFLSAAAVLAIILPTISYVYIVAMSPKDMLVEPQDDFWAELTLFAIIIGCIIVYSFNRILSKNKVVLKNMRVFLGFMTWANANNKAHGVTIFIFFFIIIVGLFTAPIFIAEGWDTFSHYIWIPGMIGGGFDIPEKMIPKTTVGVVFMGILPLASIALLVQLIGVLKNDKTLDNISFKMASGQIQSHRVAIIGYNSETETFIKNILIYDNDVFLTILVKKEHIYEIKKLLSSGDLKKRSHDDYFLDSLDKDSDVTDIISEFNIAKADEIYLFCDNENMTKNIAKSIHGRLWIENKGNSKGKLVLNDSERYPKIFVMDETLFEGEVAQKYVLLFDKNKLKNTLNLIYKKIYQLDSSKNCIDSLKIEGALWIVSKKLDIGSS